MTDVDLQEKLNGFLKSGLDKFLVGSYEEAIRELKAGEVLDSENPEILFNLGVNHARLGLYKTSAEYLEKLLNLPFTYVEVITVHKILAFSYIKDLAYPKAISVLRKVIKLSSSDIPALNMIGYCLEKQGKYNEAVKIYRSIIDIDGNNRNAFNSLAYIYSITGENLDEAVKYAEAVLESDRNNPAYLDTLGYLLLKRKEYEKAEKYLKKAYTILPFNDDIREHINELDRLKKL